jgi:hypothetical protein
LLHEKPVCLNNKPVEYTNLCNIRPTHLKNRSVQ